MHGANMKIQSILFVLSFPVTDVGINILKHV